MKTTTLFFLLLLGVFQTSFAQTARNASADEAAIKAVLEGHTQAAMDRDVERAVGYFADSPYAAISFQEPGSGYVRGAEAVKAKYRDYLSRGTGKSPDKLTTGEYLYRIVGTTAFVTYVETDTKPDGSAARTHKANYLEKMGGQWKMLGNFWMPAVKATAGDEAAIRKTIEDETAAGQSADRRAYDSHWAKVPYASFLYGGGLFVGEALSKKMDEVWATRKPRQTTVTRGNWNLRVNGTSAYATYNQRMDSGDGPPRDSLEGRYLEKTGDGWKIVGVVVLVPKP